MGKTILYIWDADYPWDVRVEKICRSLAKAEHEVHIASRNLKRNPIYEEHEGIQIHRMNTWKNDRLNYALSFPAFFSPIWTRFIDRIIKDNSIQLIIVRDLPMAIAGIWAGKRHGIPVIFDMAEDYVAMIWDIWKSKKFKGQNYVVRNPYLANFVERYTLKNIDHVMVVVDEAKEVALRGNYLKEDKITVVNNTPSPALLQISGLFESDKRLMMLKKKYSMIYTGGIQMGRGIQTVIRAIPGIVKEVPDFFFVVVGDGYAVKQLKELAQKVKAQNYILWTGWIEHKALFSYIRACKIGVIPHLRSDHVDTTIPNKIFDYMGCGLPVIASDARPMKRILNEEQCGLTFKSGDAKSLIETIVKFRNPKHNFGENGKRAVKLKYNWTVDEERLLNLVCSFSLS